MQMDELTRKLGCLKLRWIPENPTRMFSESLKQKGNLFQIEKGKIIVNSKEEC